MLIFHEGLPRSGKSYEAVVRHVIPALQAGRKVFGYVDGFGDPACQARMAEAAELPVERVRELLVPIAEDDVPNVAAVVQDNAFVVLDEAQNFWPTGRQRLDPEITKFITEHGHRGLDILLMGQDMRDVHPLWRRRVSQKVLFNKLDAIGAETRYNVTVFKATGPERFEKVTAVICKYDPRYFGTYKSHVAEGTNTANYKDSRANFRNTFFVKWVVPVSVGLLVWGIYTAWSFFHPDPSTLPKPIGATSSTVKPATVPSPAAATTPPPAAPPPAVRPVRTFVEELTAKYRPRLALAYLREGQWTGIIEFWNDDKLRERLTFRQLLALGAEVQVMGNGDLVRLGTVWVTPWPITTTGGTPTSIINAPGAVPLALGK